MASLTLDQLEAQIKQCNLNLEGLKNNIQILEDNLSLHKNHERALRQNLSILKDDYIIAMASEFKKIKQDLSIVKMKIKEIEVDLKNGKFFLSKTNKLLVDLKSQYDILVEGQKNKVLTGHFGKE